MMVVLHGSAWTKGEKHGIAWLEAKTKELAKEGVPNNCGEDLVPKGCSWIKA